MLPAGLLAGYGVASKNSNNGWQFWLNLRLSRKLASIPQKERLPAVRPLRRPLPVKMVLPASFAVKRLMRAQLNHALPAGKQFPAVGGYF